MKPNNNTNGNAQVQRIDQNFVMETGELSPDALSTLKATIARGTTDQEFALFLHVCKTRRVDPFGKLIYPVKRYDKTMGTEVMSLQSSIDYFRLAAERTGKYAGQLGPQWCGPDGVWVDVWLQKNPPAAARVAALRMDFKEPLWTVALWENYCQRDRNGSPTRFWANMGPLMIAKCAEALALRRAFPEDLAGLYTADEMQHAQPQHEDGPRAVEPISVSPVVARIAASTERLEVDASAETVSAPEPKPEPKPKPEPEVVPGWTQRDIDETNAELERLPHPRHSKAAREERAKQKAEKAAKPAKADKTPELPIPPPEPEPGEKPEAGAEGCPWWATPWDEIETAFDCSQLGYWDHWKDEKLSPKSHLALLCRQKKLPETWASAARGKPKGARHAELLRLTLQGLNLHRQYEDGRSQTPPSVGYYRCAATLAVLMHGKLEVDQPTEATL